MQTLLPSLLIPSFFHFQFFYPYLNSFLFRVLFGVVKRRAPTTSLFFNIQNCFIKQFRIKSERGTLQIRLIHSCWSVSKYLFFCVRALDLQRNQAHVYNSGILGVRNREIKFFILKTKSTIHRHHNGRIRLRFID